LKVWDKHYELPDTMRAVCVFLPKLIFAFKLIKKYFRSLSYLFLFWFPKYKFNIIQPLQVKFLLPPSLCSLFNIILFYFVLCIICSVKKKRGMSCFVVQGTMRLI